MMLVAVTHCDVLVDLPKVHGQRRIASWRHGDEALWFADARDARAQRSVSAHETSAVAAPLADRDVDVQRIVRRKPGVVVCVYLNAITACYQQQQHRPSTHCSLYPDAPRVLWFSYDAQSVRLVAIVRPAPCESLQYTVAGALRFAVGLGSEATAYATPPLTAHPLRFRPRADLRMGHPLLGGTESPLDGGETRSLGRVAASRQQQHRHDRSHPATLSPAPRPHKLNLRAEVPHGAA